MNFFSSSSRCSANRIHFGQIGSSVLKWFFYSFFLLLLLSVLPFIFFRLLFFRNHSRGFRSFGKWHFPCAENGKREIFDGNVIGRRRLSTGCTNWKSFDDTLDGFFFGDIHCHSAEERHVQWISISPGGIFNRIQFGNNYAVPVCRHLCKCRCCYDWVGPAHIHGFWCIRFGKPIRLGEYWRFLPFACCSEALRDGQIDGVSSIACVSAHLPLSSPEQSHWVLSRCVRRRTNADLHNLHDPINNGHICIRQTKCLGRICLEVRVSCAESHTHTHTRSCVCGRE